MLNQHRTAMMNRRRRIASGAPAVPAAPAMTTVYNGDTGSGIGAMSLQNTVPTGAANGTKITFYAKYTPFLDNKTQFLAEDSFNSRMVFSTAWVGTGYGPTLTVKDNAGATICTASSLSDYDNGTEVEFMVSYDSVTQTAQVYVNGVEDLEASPTLNTGTIPFADMDNWGILCRGYNNTTSTLSNFTRFAVWQGVAADLSDSSVRDAVANPNATVGGTKLIDIYGTLAEINAGTNHAGTGDFTVINSGFTNENLVPADVSQFANVWGSQTGWTDSGGVELIADGTNAANANLTNNGAGERLTVSENTTYDWYLNCTAVTTTGKTFKITARYRDASSQLSTEDIYNTTVDATGTLSGSFTTPADCTEIEFTLYAVTANADYHFDQLIVAEQPANLLDLSEPYSSGAATLVTNNGDGTYTCEATGGSVMRIVWPVNTTTHGTSLSFSGTVTEGPNLEGDEGVQIRMSDTDTGAANPTIQSEVIVTGTEGNDVVDITDQAVTAGTSGEVYLQFLSTNCAAGDTFILKNFSLSTS